MKVGFGFLLVGMTAGPLAAQAVLVGRVIHDSTKAPIEGVELVVQPNGKRAVSGAEGRFVLDALPSGVGNTLIRKIGFRPVILKTLVFSDDTLEFDIRLQPTIVELEPIEVRANSFPPGMQSYADHRISGFGSFLDPELLRKSEHRRLSDLLRNVRGVRIRPRGAGAVASSTRGCTMAVWLDGIKTWAPDMRIPPPDIDQIPVTQLEAVEVYRGAADTPIDLGGFGGNCGTIVLWTRRR